MSNSLKKQKVVWDLFGGGQNSIYNALKPNDEFKVYTFDVTESTRPEHFKIDLAQENIVEAFHQLMKEHNIPKPDIITSSTLCQSFSCVLNMKGGGTCFWKYNQDKTKLIQRPVAEFETLKNGFTKNLKADVQLFIAQLGKKCIDNTITLIKEFNPTYWYIENPKSSLLWKYIALNRKDFYDPETMFLNEASCGKYGFLTTKATYFLSNIKIPDLLKGKIDPPYFSHIDENGEKWYVLKEDNTIKMRQSVNSRIIGLANIKGIIRAWKTKSGMGAMDFVMSTSPQPNQKTRKQNEQTSEAGPASAIPHPLIVKIFSHFQ